MVAPRDEAPQNDETQELRDAVERARTATDTELDALLYHGARVVQDALLENPHLAEQHLLLLLSRKDLAREVLARIAANREWTKSDALRLALVKHPRTPRQATLALLKFIHLFDLAAVARTPGVPAEIKRLAENTILSQREGLALGQRLTLARRGSSRLAGELLLDPDARVSRAALSNPALTEAAVAAALLNKNGGSTLTALVADDPRWFQRRTLKLALLRSPHLSLARFAGILPELTLAELNDLTDDPRLSAKFRAYAARVMQTRARPAASKGL